MSTEAILGWVIIAGFGYIVGEYTDLFAYLIMYPKKAARKIFGAATTDRLLGAGGLVGGLWFGPVLWEIGATALAGFAGGAAGVIAIDSLGFELTSGELLAVGAVAVVAWVFASASATEDDD
ncbi:hypothetical protein C469_00380 [Halorubrum lipolyticum DSM 21995]|uniref:Uncharacterized protein n=2 Tax=Halorubrum lipolyticum TaxID=368624 RepID=M0P3K6_9EURY|nr:hypothetical protein C469_00380 [Halorubrum lipolyticum DSM 21995]